ncbi:junctional sarcoplasmic reticulum protein 1 isoform X1 [Hemicordylus capensis]|uniref:junctional sarcoplasmic reticulum protein 1 isoform X1 n=2 Tax=Hemicordylus capensis TaxID=884348 RepID=UPI002302D761|nr:junctional sarcoplasmic reticulum protein 1 isoform X1 [Hemicordylus capensis]
MLSQQQPPGRAPLQRFACLCRAGGLGTARPRHGDGKQEVQGGEMATGPCEILERDEEGTESLKELPAQKESIQKPLKEDGKADAKTAASKEEVNGTPNGLEKEDTNKLHVITKDLDEFVDSMSEATPAALPGRSLEADKHPAPQKAPEKLPRAEQVAEKVLRAERAPWAEKVPGTEKTPEKLPRAEKAPEKAPRAEKVSEKTLRAEKPAEKARPAASSAPRTIPAKRKVAAGPPKDTLPWEGLTLNKCIVIASFLALLSVGCQVAQDLIDLGGEVLHAELSAWTAQEGSVGEVEELWFYERWFQWTDLDEPPDVDEEEEEEPIEIEEEEEEEPTTETEEEEEEEGEEPAAKVEPRKSRERAKREKPSKDKAPRGRKVPLHEEEEEEEEEEEKHQVGKHRHRESKGKEARHPREEGKARQRKHEVPPSKEHKRERHPQEDGRGRHKAERDRGKGRPLKHERDSKPHPHEDKDRKPRPVVPRAFFKDGAHQARKPRLQEGKRHD